MYSVVVTCAADNGLASAATAPASSRRLLDLAVSGLNSGTRVFCVLLFSDLVSDPCVNVIFPLMYLEPISLKRYDAQRHSPATTILQHVAEDDKSANFPSTAFLVGFTATG
jgi:hypothetical protein